MNAVRGGSLPLLRELIARGANLNTQGFLGMNPLGYAIELAGWSRTIEEREQWLAIAKELISAGADINAGKRSPLWSAVSHAVNCEEGNVVFLKDGTEFNYSVALRIIKNLIAAGADINKKDDLGESILRLAIMYQRLSLIRDLMQLGAELNDRDVKFISNQQLEIDAGREPFLSNLAEIRKTIADTQERIQEDIKTAASQSQDKPMRIIAEYLVG